MCVKNMITYHDNKVIGEKVWTGILWMEHDAGQETNLIESIDEYFIADQVKEKELEGIAFEEFVKEYVRLHPNENNTIVK